VALRRATCTAVLIGLLATACAGSNASTGGTRGPIEITVGAAASLSRAFPRIAQVLHRRDPDLSVRFTFGGTDQIAAQIEQGAPVDVFAGASTKYGDQLKSDRLIEAPVAFATNRLMLVVPTSNPARIASGRDLERPGVKLVVAGPTVPAGAYTRTVVSTLDGLYGAGYSKKVLANVVSNETDVESVATKVAQGEADAGFVYATDLRANPSGLTGIDLPAEAGAVATYPIAVVVATTRRRAATEFVDIVRGPIGQAVLRQAGFGPPP
jgi:molybdate transport system substrate-binding protein